MITWWQSIHWLYVKLAPLYQIISDCYRRTWVRETIWPWVLARYTADEEICFSSVYSRHHISPSMSYFVYFFNNLRAVHFQHTCSTSKRERRSVGYWAKEHGNNAFPSSSSIQFRLKWCSNARRICCWTTSSVALPVDQPESAVTTPSVNQEHIHEWQHSIWLLSHRWMVASIYTWLCMALRTPLAC